MAESIFVFITFDTVDGFWVVRYTLQSPRDWL